jgi:hypothetical protein
VASGFTGAEGEGRLGWLYLLAAKDLNPDDEDILTNLVDNYMDAGLHDMAFEELLAMGDHPTASRLLAATKRQHRREWAAFVARQNSTRKLSLPVSVPEPEVSLLFPTMLGRWHLARSVVIIIIIIIIITIIIIIIIIIKSRVS